MWVSKLHVHGMAGCGELRTLERIATLPRAMMDALSLFCMAVDSNRVLAGMARLGWVGTADEGELQVERTGAVRRMLSHDANAALRITLGFMPDPPLFGRLRHAVLRDPAIAVGLAEGSFTARVGWLFTPDYHHARPDLIGARLGNVDLPSGETPWVAPLLRDISRRIQVADWGPIQPDVESLAAALCSADPERRARAVRAVDALDVHFGMQVHVVRDGKTELGVGADLRPLRWMGPEAEQTLRTVVAAMVDAPDVLALPWVPTEVERRWLEACCTGDDAVLEQVLVAS